MEKIELYDKRNIDDLVWTDDADQQYAKNYLVPLIKNGVKTYIGNVHTEMMVIKVGKIILPLNINYGEYDNSYVCSPYNHYVVYAEEELCELKKTLVEKILAQLLHLIGCFLRRTKFNKVVHINNWLLSTNLYPALSDGILLNIINFIQHKFPKHTIIFRSLNYVSNASIIHILQKTGCKAVGSRQIYGIDLDSGILPTMYDVKRDLKLLMNTDYEIVPHDGLSINDASRIVELYNMLYLDKYSSHNPWFNEQFIQQALRTKLFDFFAFRKEGRIDAVLGFFQRNGVMTTPLVGYDTKLPQSVGLYRLISIKILLEAARRRVYLNNSSGAAQFKRNRGSIGHMEYSLVYDKHLPYWRRISWSLLRYLVNNLGILLMKKYRL